MDDETTHDWLKGELADGEQGQDVHVGAAHAERVLRRRTNVHDWMMIVFMVVAVVTATIVVIYGQHADRRAAAASIRSTTTNTAVKEALRAQQRSSDAIATLADDFAALVVAKTDAERDAALQKLLADKQEAEDAKRAADLELAQLAAQGSTTTTSSSRGQSEPATTTPRSTPSTTASTTSTSTSTTMASPLSPACVIVTCPLPGRPVLPR